MTCEPIRHPGSLSLIASGELWYGTLQRFVALCLLSFVFLVLCPAGLLKAAAGTAAAFVYAFSLLVGMPGNPTIIRSSPPDVFVLYGEPPATRAVGTGPVLSDELMIRSVADNLEI